jgi:hypothetical protein
MADKGEQEIYGVSRVKSNVKPTLLPYFGGIIDNNNSWPNAARLRSKPVRKGLALVSGKRKVIEA